MYNFAFNFFYLLLYCFLAANNIIKLIKGLYATGWFVPMEIKKCTPNANIYVQEHFITASEAEMLKIFKNSLSPINRSSYKKECI